MTAWRKRANGLHGTVLSNGHTQGGNRQEIKSYGMKIQTGSTIAKLPFKTIVGFVVKIKVDTSDGERPIMGCEFFVSISILPTHRVIRCIISIIPLLQIADQHQGLVVNRHGRRP